MVKCPYCGAWVEVNKEFTELEDCGDCVVGKMTLPCVCGEDLIVYATFVWDECYEVR